MSTDIKQRFLDDLKQQLGAERFERLKGPARDTLENAAELYADIVTAGLAGRPTMASLTTLEAIVTNLEATVPDVRHANSQAFSDAFWTVAARVGSTALEVFAVAAKAIVASQAQALVERLAHK